jgi:hypothetical protein
MVGPYTTEDNHVLARDQKKILEVYVNKFSQGIFGILHEAVLVNGDSLFVYVDQSGNIQTIDQINDYDRIIKPPLRHTSLTKEYSFDTEDELHQMWNEVREFTIDDAFRISQHIWSQYVSTNSYVITLLAADSIFSYMQDAFGMTHYNFTIGDNDSGKSAILNVANEIVYRPFTATSVSDAVLYRVLGNVEEGQAILLLDEANRISEVMLDILKGGYKTGGYVLRVDDLDNKKKVAKYFTYGQKWLAAENSISGDGAKGANERNFYIHAIRGTPKSYIADILKPKNKNKFKKELDEISNFRKTMLLYKLKHFGDNYPDLQLSVNNRDRELTESILSLFYGSNCINQIVDTLSIFLTEKRQKKIQTVEAILYDIVTEFRDRLEESLKKIASMLPSDIFDILSRRMKERKLNQTLDNDDIFEIPSDVIIELLKRNPIAVGNTIKETENQ